MGVSPPPYIALSRVDPLVNFRGGTPKNRRREHGVRLQEKIWAWLGHMGGWSNQGFGHTLAEAVWTHLRLTHSLWAPYVDFRVHSCRCVGLPCHLGPKILVRTVVVCRKCLFSWTWANLLGWGPSNSRARVECSDVYFSLCMSTIFTCMQTWLPVNNDSPKLVEMISIKVLILVWCLFWHRCLQELTVSLST